MRLFFLPFPPPLPFHLFYILFFLSPPLSLLSSILSCLLLLLPLPLPPPSSSSFTSSSPSSSSFSYLYLVLPLPTHLPPSTPSPSPPPLPPPSFPCVSASIYISIASAAGEPLGEGRRGSESIRERCPSGLGPLPYAEGRLHLEGRYRAPRLRVSEG